MKNLIIIIFIFCVAPCAAQNLIPNGSFEDTISYGGGFTFPKQWTSPSGFNSVGEHYTPFNQFKWTVPQNFFGNQHAYNGSSYFGLVMYLLIRNPPSMRDYIQTKLRNNLTKDSTYCMQLYVNLPDSMTHASRGQLGIYLSNTAVSSTSNFNLPYTPQLIVSPTNYITDKLNWTEFNFQYTAVGGERYLTIGNFNDTLGIDTFFVGGGKDPNYYGTYYFIDNLYLGHCDSITTSIGVAENSANKQEEFSIYPNPAHDQITVEFTASSNENGRFELYNTLGQLQLTEQLNGDHQKHIISLTELQQGIYFYRLISNSTLTKSGNLVID
ncbi:T9SS type A sorting domain-containing protein [Acidiluteibacter ferrifornacis]|uniref:T9SS type A sorting domain-containing protein n=1 Tax=Acidiluteibacter ferrifornacis TaxID=2692424 RepID=A0A6N9NK63_9FLAO|nr:T9SS type A sorting domain-containing protein [Acidiluteibacter ferrifornacis]NBG65861.1 T9SS type A sorting domain-containing protein [Acidiluteibacter ferrifornacis]